MIKETIKYFVDKDFLSGYGYVIQPKILNENSILDFLCEWSKGKNVTIYSHSLWQKEEPRDGPEKFHYVDQYEKDQEKLKKAYEKMSKEGIEPHKQALYKIPYVNNVFYLDVWYQEKQ